MSPARAAEPTSRAPVIALAAVAAAAAAAYRGFPAMVPLWVAAIAAAWTEPPPRLTGKKDATGLPTASGPVEKRRLAHFTVAREARVSLVVPSADWMPGWPVLGAWVVALTVAAGAFTLPVVHADLRWANAVAAFILIAVGSAVRRRTMVDDDTCPGVRLDALAGLIRRARHSPAVVANLVAAAAAGASGWWATRTYLPAWTVSSAGDAGAHTTAYVDDGLASAMVDYSTRNPTVAATAAALVAALVVMAPTWRIEALAHWRRVVAHRSRWAPRWTQLKHDPSPRLVDVADIGPATVETFIAPAGAGAMAFWPLAVKVAPTIGAGSRIAILETPDEEDGTPLAGTRHPLRFEIVTWGVSGVPDPAQAGTDAEVAVLVARCAASWTVDPAGYGRPVLVSVSALHATEAPPDNDPDPGEGNDTPVEDPKAETAPTAPVTAPGPGPCAWVSRWAWPDGPDLATIRKDLDGALAPEFGCEVLIDHRAPDGGELYFGALTVDPPEFWANEEDWADRFAELALEDLWSHRWSQMLKQATLAPIIQQNTVGSADLADGTTVWRTAFVTRMGVDPQEFFGLESKLATVLGAAPFVAVAGVSASGDRSGGRHGQAFYVYWAEAAVPGSPQSLAPTATSRARRPGRAKRDDPAAWVLAGHVNQAFRAARLAQPEVVTATCLTSPRARAHIWEISLRLHGGVTLADIQGARTRIRSTLGVSWLRAEPSAEGVVLYAGVEPQAAELADPDADELRLVALDWAQAWLDAGVTGAGGLVPVLTGLDHLPANPSVEVLDFNLPSGVEPTGVKAALGKLRTATGNDFVEVRPGATASKVRLLACEVNPLPPMAPVDIEAVDASAAIPFATGVDGEPVAFDPSDSPHLLIAGTTGAGKSVTAQVLMYGAVVRGWDLYVIDPVKGAADFRFAEPWTRATATTPFQAAGVMAEAYAEVMRRKAVNAAAGVGSFRDLDDPPPYMAVMIDEFTSLMGQSSVPPKTDDPSIEAERQRIVAENQARAEIGVKTGQIAREARSVGVVLWLATQKLTVKMLDSIPGSGDIKDLTLDTRLPVPVSERFGDGWARNDELDIGDLLYAVDGTTVPIVGFSPTRINPEVYEVAFDDGQLVTAGVDHLWTVSPNHITPDQIAEGQGPAAEALADLIDLIPVGIRATTADIATLAGVDVAAVAELAATAGLDACSTGLDGSLRDLSRGGRSAAQATQVPASERFYDVAEVAAAADARPHGDEVVRSTGELADALDRGEALFVPTAEAIRGDDTAVVDPYRLGWDITSLRSIPSTYLRARVPERLALLAGITDSTGTVDDRGEVTVELPEGRLSAQVVELARSLGIIPRRSRRTARGRDGTTTHWHRMTFAPHRRPEHHRRRRVVEVRPVGARWTRCIAVDHPRHLFLVEGFVPTHNTNMARILLGKANFGERSSALKGPDDAPKLDGEVPRGRGLWEAGTGTAEVVQFWYGDQRALGASLSERRDPTDPTRRLDLSAFVEPEVEVAGEIVEVDDDEVIDLGEIDLGLTLDDLDAEVVTEGGPDPDETGDEVIEDDDGPVALVATTTSNGAVALSAPEPPDLAPGWQVDAVTTWSEAHPDPGAVVLDLPGLEVDHPIYGAAIRDVLVDILEAKGMTVIDAAPDPDPEPVAGPAPGPEPDEPVPDAEPDPDPESDEPELVAGPAPEPESGEPEPGDEPTPEPVADPRSDGGGDEMFPDLWTTPAEAGDEPDLFA